MYEVTVKYEHCLVVVAVDSSYPSVVLLARFLFWTEWGQSPCICRARLDGSDQVILVNSGIAWPNGISIDYEVQYQTPSDHSCPISSDPSTSS